MTTTPQAALLREAAQNALITLDGIASANPRDKADFETPDEWIAWAKSRARFAADALRAPVAQEVYAERILRQMLHESDQTQSMQVEPALTEEEIWFIASDGMRSAAGGIYQSSVIEFARAVEQAVIAKLQATQAEPVQAVRTDFETEAANKLHAAWINGREACRDSEFIGVEAMHDAFNRSSTLNDCLALDQAERVQAGELPDHAVFAVIDSMGWDLDDSEKDDMHKLCRAVLARAALASQVKQAGELPELPEPFALSVSVHEGDTPEKTYAECMLYQKHPNEKQKLYTADQMHAYARASLAARKPLSVDEPQATPIPCAVAVGAKVFEVGTPFCDVVDKCLTDLEQSRSLLSKAADVLDDTGNTENAKLLREIDNFLSA